MLTRQRVGELLDEHGLAPSRSLGQNFLCDPNTVAKIVRLAGVERGDAVIEIGPGLGSLTLGLRDAGANVLAVELDRHLVPVLRTIVDDGDRSPTDGPIRILQADAMILDWDTELAAASEAWSIEHPERWSVVANLPYNVATPLVLDLLADRPEFTRFLVMVQAEVAERLAAGPGTKVYGIPSVLVAASGRARIVGRVPPQVFLPQPRVDSALVRIDRHDAPVITTDLGTIATVVKAGFGQRRKMLRRSLSGLLDEAEIAAADVDPTARAEQLDLAAWDRLAAATARSTHGERGESA